MNAPNHQVHDFFNGELPALQVFHIALEILGEKKSCPGQHPVVGIPHHQNVVGIPQGDTRTVGKQEMTPAEPRFVWIKGRSVALQDR